MTDVLSIASAFFMHSGSRHISFDLTNGQKALLSHPFSKVAIMFSMFYISTRKIAWSLLLLVSYFLAVQVLLNENHKFNVFSKNWLVDQGLKEPDVNNVDSTDIYKKNMDMLSK